MDWQNPVQVRSEPVSVRSEKGNVLHYLTQKQQQIMGLMSLIALSFCQLLTLHVGKLLLEPCESYLEMPYYKTRVWIERDSRAYGLPLIVYFTFEVCRAG